MEITNPLLKKLIFEVVSFSEEVDENGKALPRKTFKKDLYRATVSLLKKLDDEAEFAVDTEGVMKKAQEEGRKFLTEEEAAKIVYKARKDMKEGDAIFVESIRFTEAVLDVTEDEKKAIKKYWDETTEMKDYGVETLDALEALLAE